MAQCTSYRTAGGGATFDECGNPVDPGPTPFDRIDKIRNQAQLNKASKDKFIVVIDLPPIIKRATTGSIRECETIEDDWLQFSIFGAVATPVNSPAQSLGYSGHKIKIASHAREVEPINLQYVVDNNYQAYWVLWKWADAISSALHGFAGKSSGNVGPYKDAPSQVLPPDYMTSVVVYGLDEMNAVKIEWAYRGAFLTNLGGINYSTQDQAVVTSSFTFDYSFVTSYLH